MGVYSQFTAYFKRAIKDTTIWISYKTYITIEKK